MLSCLSFSLFFFLLHFMMMFFCFSLIGAPAFIFSFSFFGFLGVDFSFVITLDLFSCIFSGIVSLITGVVVSYSYFYMGSMVGNKRYYLMLVLFVFSMFLLIHSCSLIFVMLGWDGLGLTSFCLIIFYGGASVQRSGLVSIYLNRLGDVGLILCIFYLMDFGALSSGTMWLAEPGIIYYLFGLSCITKSAQFPFSSWLPAAMSAPTPISSLVHSSTLVTAGIYLMIRFSPLFFFVYNSLLFSLFSIITMVLAGVIAVLERDMKSVIAMSTLSQLGLMMYMLSLGEQRYCFFHLIMHAVFKSLLFMSCGGLLIMSHGNQDFRFKSGSVVLCPLMSFFFCVCSLSLGGMTFLSGFFSKDLCLDSIFEFSSGVLLTLMFYFGCLLTLIYSIQLFVEGLSSSSLLAASVYADLGLIYCFPNFILLLMSIVLGKMFFFIFFAEEFDFSFSVMKMLGFMFFIVSGLVASLLNKSPSSIHLKDFMVKMLFLDYLFGFFVSSLGRNHILIDSLDLTWGEFVSVTCNYDNFSKLSKLILLFFSEGGSLKIILMFLVYIFTCSFMII